MATDIGTLTRTKATFVSFVWARASSYRLVHGMGAERDACCVCLSYSKWLELPSSLRKATCFGCLRGVSPPLHHEQGVLQSPRFGRFQASTHLLWRRATGPSWLRSHQPPGASDADGDGERRGVGTLPFLCFLLLCRHFKMADSQNLLFYTSIEPLELLNSLSMCIYLLCSCGKR